MQQREAIRLHGHFDLAIGHREVMLRGAPKVIHHRPRVGTVVVMRHLEVIHHRSRFDAALAIHRLEVIHSVRDWTDF